MAVVIQQHSITEPNSGLSCDLAVHAMGEISNPLVMCVHGLTRNATDFYTLAEHLAEKYYVLMPDIPGRGHSPNLPNPALYNNLFYAALLKQLLAQMNINQLSWIGTSMGGLIGLIMAATAPEQISRLLLNDVGYIVPAAALKRISGYVGVQPNSKDHQVLRAQVRLNLEPFGITDPEILEQFIDASITPDEQGGYRLNYDPAIAQSFAEMSDEDINLTELWNLVHCPILVFRGEKSDLLPENIAKEMVTSKQGVELLEVPHAGHAPSLTHAFEIAKIKQWLDSTCVNA